MLWAVFRRARGSGGIAGNVTWLLAARGLQGIGHAGIQAMGQIVMAAIVSPRERGKYSGYIGSAFGVGTVAGPLIGGVIVDTPWLGWHWCFYIVVPIAVLSMALMYRNLSLPAVTASKVKIDLFGAALLSAAISGLMVWATVAGRDFPWMSLPSAAFVIPSVTALVVFVLRTASCGATDPVEPLREPHDADGDRAECQCRSHDVRAAPVP